MLLLRPHTTRQNPTVKPSQPTEPAPTPVGNAQLPAINPVRLLGSIEEHGQRALQLAREFARSRGVPETDSDFAAMVLLRLARDISVVRLEVGKEVAVLHPAFGRYHDYVDERGRQLTFSKVAEHAPLSTEAKRYSIFAVDGELVARSPSWRHQVQLGLLLPQPWYSAVRAMGQQAMSAPKLNRFHYEAKLYLLKSTSGHAAAQTSRMMVQSHRRHSDQMRQFKGDRQSWAAVP
ncbi:MAG: hypothetical protein EBZ48_11820 [Proteobacteria bacterium]|nr:hypothetical protein [Pseudomonadota bacterium]